MPQVSYQDVFDVQAWVPTDDSQDDWRMTRQAMKVLRLPGRIFGPPSDLWNMSPQSRAQLVEDAAIAVCDRAAECSRILLDWAMDALERPLAATLSLEWPQGTVNTTKWTQLDFLLQS